MNFVPSVFSRSIWMEDETKQNDLDLARIYIVKVKVGKEVCICILVLVLGLGLCIRIGIVWEDPNQVRRPLPLLHRRS